MEDALDKITKLLGRDLALAADPDAARVPDHLQIIIIIMIIMIICHSHQYHDNNHYHHEEIGSYLADHVLSLGRRSVRVLLLFPGERQISSWSKNPK